jgi:hypothetical protein
MLTEGFARNDGFTRHENGGISEILVQISATGRRTVGQSVVAELQSAKTLLVGGAKCRDHQAKTNKKNVYSNHRIVGAVL